MISIEFAIRVKIVADIKDMAVGAVGGDGWDEEDFIEEVTFQLCPLMNSIWIK